MGCIVGERDGEITGERVENMIGIEDAVTSDINEFDEDKALL
jgi:hypothetical protein